jgi:ferrous iron transport protein A
LGTGSPIFMTADQLSLNQSGRIVEVFSSPLKINLMELGFLPGKSLTLQHKAPSGGPLAFQMEDTLLALRKNEAALIRIELI